MVERCTSRCQYEEWATASAVPHVASYRSRTAFVRIARTGQGPTPRLKDVMPQRSEPALGDLGLVGAVNGGHGYYRAGIFQDVRRQECNRRRKRGHGNVSAVTHAQGNERKDPGYKFPAGR